MVRLISGVSWALRRRHCMKSPIRKRGAVELPADPKRQGLYEPRKHKTTLSDLPEVMV